MNASATQALRSMNARHYACNNHFSPRVNYSRNTTTYFLVSTVAAASSRPTVVRNVVTFMITVVETFFAQHTGRICSTIGAMKYYIVLCKHSATYCASGTGAKYFVFQCRFHGPCFLAKQVLYQRLLLGVRWNFSRN